MYREVSVSLFLLDSDHGDGMNHIPSKNQVNILYLILEIDNLSVKTIRHALCPIYSIQIMYDFKGSNQQS